MLNKKIIIGSRNSALAKKQTEIFISKLNAIGFKDIKTIYLKSSGDLLNEEKFKSFGGKGLFTKEIDNMILENKIDFGVHSAKDIPSIIDEKLSIGAFLKREDVRDVLITCKPGIKSILELPKNSSLGTSSPRRIAYIKTLRPDLKVIALRGNIETRINKIKQDKLFSIIIAKAGINRLKLKLTDTYSTPLSTREILPSPGQGAIAIIYKKNNKTNKNILKIIDNKDTRTSLSAERALIKEINGDCFTPLAAYARIIKKKLILDARLFTTDFNFFINKKLEGDTSSAEYMGKRMAKNLLKNLKNNYANKE